MSSKTPQPSEAALDDLLSMLQQNDFETSFMAEDDNHLQQNAHKQHILALEARYDRIKAGAPKPGDLASMRAWARDWFDGGFGQDGGWDAAEAWVYNRKEA